MWYNIGCSFFKHVYVCEVIYFYACVRDVAALARACVQANLSLCIHITHTHTHTYVKECACVLVN